MEGSQLQTLLNNIFGIDNNTSATIMITVLVFITGLLITELLKKATEYFKRKRIRNICLYNFQNLNKGVIKQSKYYLKYAESLTFENITGFNFSNVLIPSIQAFENIGYENMYDAYFSGFENILKGKKNLKAFEKLWSSIIAVPFWQAEMKNLVENQLENFNKWNDLRNNSLGDFYKAFDPLITKYLNVKVHIYLAEYIHELDEIQFEYQNHQNFRNPVIVQELMVDKTLKINRKYKDIVSVHDLNPPLLLASMAFENMKKNLHHNQLQTKKYLYAFKGHGRIIATALKII